MRERVSESEKEEEERWGNSILLQLIFFKYFTWILAAVVLQKTKGNEPWLLEPKTTHSVRKSRHSYCLEHRERQSQSKLLKSALGYMKHIGKKISWWKNICDVAGGKWFCQGEHPCKKQVSYRAGVLLLLNDNKLVVWGISGLIFKYFREIIRLHCKKCLSNICYSLVIQAFGSAISGQRSKYCLKWNPRLVLISEEICW